MVANEILSKLLSLANQVLPDEQNARIAEPAPFQKPRRALIVPSRFIGDNLLLTPFIRNLRRQLNPGARLDIVATPAVAPLYETLPGLDRVHMEKRDALRHPRQFLEAGDYDTIMMCRYAPLWAHAAVQAEVPQRVGFDLARMGIHRLERWGQCLTHSIPSTSVYDTRHQVDVYLDMLRQLSLDVQVGPPECRLTPADVQKARHLIAPLGRVPKVLIHLSSGSPGKSWPTEYWRRLAAWMAGRWSPVFVAIGSAADAGLYRELEARVPLINLCGQTSLRESIALLGQVDLAITLDTAVAHMAAVAGTPRLVVLYGPTNQRQWQPMTQPGTALAQVYLDLPCRPCMARTCEHKACMKELGVPRVQAAVETLLNVHPLA